MKPAPDWGPADKLQREEYSHMRHDTTEHPLLWWGRNADVVLFTNNENKPEDISNDERHEIVVANDVTLDYHETNDVNSEANQADYEENVKGNNSDL